MLPKPYRLHLRQTPAFFTQAQRFSTRFLVWYYSPQVPEQPQVAVIVPKKQVASAVKRNYIKRQLHSLLFHQRLVLPTKEIVLYWKTAHLPSRAEIEQDLLVGLAKLASPRP